MKSDYMVSGMTCQHCANHVTEEVQEIPGVTKVHVDVAGPMTIVSESEISFDDVKAAVEEAGDYTVTQA